MDVPEIFTRSKTNFAFYHFGLNDFILTTEIDVPHFVDMYKGNQGLYIGFKKQKKKQKKKKKMAP